MSSKLEINIRTLIVQCEELIKEDSNNWLLKKYIRSLDTMIKELENSDEKPKVTVIDEYRRRCSTLKEKTNYVEPPLLQSKLRSKLTTEPSGDAVVKEVHQLQNAKYTNSMRRDLLGIGAFANDLRKRTTNSTTSGSDEMSQAMKHSVDMQEKIAEDMLALTRNLKEQTETANRIIRRDTEIVSKSANMSDMNYASLNKEADILKDHSKRAWKCWMWIMIGLVMVIFIFMVLFMKMVKKRAT